MNGKQRRPKVAILVVTKHKRRMTKARGGYLKPRVETIEVRRAEKEVVLWKFSRFGGRRHS